MASIRDVAKEAHVGVATVSRVLNNTGYVSEDARERIEKAMKELNYTPNELARNLYRKKAGIVAILVPNSSNPFFAEYVYYAESALYRNGYKTMICNTDNEGNAESEYLDMLSKHIVDGIITGVHSLDMKEYTKIKKPIVALDRYIDEVIPVVRSNHREGGRLAAEELIRNGCKEVIHFCEEASYKAPYLERHDEFEKVMRENGVITHKYNLAWNRLDDIYFKQAVADIFEQNISFDGIFGVDEVAIEAMNECIRRHRKVPRDVKVVAYDGTYLTSIVEPELTAIVQPIEELAKESVRILVNMMDGKQYNYKQSELPVMLKRGKTTLE